MMRAWIVIAGMLLLDGSMAHAQNILDAHYDPKTDTLIVDLVYRGTNWNHKFSLQWDKCKPRIAGGGSQVAAMLIDDQWNDRALMDYRRRIPFSLEGMPCRPAEMTLRTAAGFEITLPVPALPRFARVYELAF